MNWRPTLVKAGVTALTLAFCAVALRVLACGPFFPNTLLDLGDRAVLTAPEARFQREIERMKLVAPRHRALPATNHIQQTFDAELADLREALDNAHLPLAERDVIVEGHSAQRKRIALFERTEEVSSGKPTANDWVNEVFVLRPNPTNVARILGPLPRIVPGLPGEFGDYFRGSIAWHLGKMAEARGAWTALLARPAVERHFKSTWAAFMLGKSWEEEDSKRASRYFQEVRALAKSGFADTLSLAASSLGWEARLAVRDGNFAPAIDLYLEQAAGGDPSAVISLRWTASWALHTATPKLRTLAAHPNARRVITAYMISGGWRENPMDVDSAMKERMISALGEASRKVSLLPKPKPGWHTLKEPGLRWLEAVEAAGAKDVEAAEQLALAAYQGGQMEMAQRWIDLARPTPVTQWLRAKLLLRDGKVDAAGALIADLARRFPVEADGTNRPALPGLGGSLYVSNGYHSRTSVSEQWSGELGVFRLARREYTESLEALLRSGYWVDAAYVAERVLTLDELKSYVDRYWPEKTRPKEKTGRAAERNMGSAEEQASEAQLFTLAEQIRYLLARRLARAERWNEAIAYFPIEWQPPFNRLCHAHQDAQNLELAPAERAAALFDAAKITREMGLELIGTEVEPDWQIHAGNFEGDVTLANRVSLQTSNVLAATTEEIERASRHTTDPEKRWHYRYRAAALAWEAAKLMPDNSEETARVLCAGGSWIKLRDLKGADIFYKALVRRCRKTAIGEEADRLRWFPLLDAGGNLRPRSEQPLSPEEKAAREKAAQDSGKSQP